MKKTLVVLAVASLAGSAFAQSSVTIYGRVNVAVERQEDGNVKSTRLNNVASRLGFRGTEDMGGGLKAGFVLEHGFDVSNGTAAASFWGRQSEVFLSSNAGTLRLGNFTSEAYYATADYISMHNHDTGRSSDALYAYVTRDVNKIAYRTPEFVKNLSLEVAASLKENLANGKNSFDFAANYAIGAVALGAGYSKNGDAQQGAVRVLWDASPFLLGAYYQRDEDTFHAGKRNNFRVSAAYMLGASEFHVNFGFADKYKSVSNSEGKQGTVAYNYNLSKRTKVYAYYTKVDDGGAGYYGGDSQSVALGVRHNF